MPVASLVLQDQYGQIDIAQWNQSTSTWADIGGVGGPTNDIGEVTALYVNNGVLYVGGDFQEANSCSLTVNNIAAYDGWAALPSTRPGFRPGLSNVLSVATLTNFPTPGYSILFAGGDYEGGTDAVGHPAVNHIAQYAGLSVPLPVGLISFDAVYDQSDGLVNLTWSTATQIDNKEFTIEKSMDGENWEFVTTVAGAATSSVKLSYSAIDASPYQWSIILQVNTNRL